jgi:hypothetical protein
MSAGRIAKKDYYGGSFTCTVVIPKFMRQNGAECDKSFWSGTQTMWQGK